MTVNCITFKRNVRWIDTFLTLVSGDVGNILYTIKNKFFQAIRRALQIEINYWLLINNEVKFNSDQTFDSESVFTN